MIAKALRRAALLGLLASACASSGAAPADHEPSRKQEGVPLEVIQDVALPGPANRFDYQSYDAKKHRLFIAHLGSGTLVAFDTQEEKVIGEAKPVPDAHGVIVVPELERVYVSATGANEIVAIDEIALKVISRAPGGVYPDGIAYAPGVHKLYVSDEAGKTETVIDAETGQRVKTIDLGGEAGNSQYDSASKHVFVNVQTRNELVEIDPSSDAIVRRHPLPGAQGNHGLLIDSSHRLAFVACVGNNRLLVVDLSSMRVIGSHPVGKDPDVLALDDKLGVLYVAAESGVLTVFKQEGKSLRELGRSLFAPHAHTVAVDSETHHVYFPLENVRGRPVLRIARPPSGGRR